MKNSCCGTNSRKSITIASTVGNDSFPLFLRYHLMITSHGMLRIYAELTTITPTGILSDNLNILLPELLIFIS